LAGKQLFLAFVRGLLMKLDRRNFIKKIASAGMMSSASYMLLTNLGCVSVPAKVVKRPNVLWLIGEDMGKQLSCYGDTTIETPNLDRLASEGTRFDNAFCSAPICSPSRSSFNTGMHALSINAHDHRTANELQKRLPDEVKTITQLFAAEGYHSCLMGNPKEDFNFIANAKTFQSRDWSNRKEGQPFFCVYNFAEPHRWEWGKWEELPVHIDSARVTIPPVYLDGPIMRKSMGKYYDFILELDRKLGLVLARLEDEGMLDNTIIFFFGDNGRTIYRGKQWLYDEGLSVPLIARYPGVFDRGAVRTELVSLIDMAPTSLELAGLKVPSVMQGQVVAGVNAKRRKYIFASRDLCDITRDKMRCVRDEEFKYIRNYNPEKGYEVSRYTKKVHPEWTEAKELYEADKLSREQGLMFAKSKPREELYDIKSDPYETVNLAGEDKYRKVLKRLSGELDKWLEEVNGF
jgi:N-sulfoglucosamine sulfohydrolase